MGVLLDVRHQPRSDASVDQTLGWVRRRHCGRQSMFDTGGYIIEVLPQLR